MPVFSANVCSCFLSYKDTHLKAIHNPQVALFLGKELFSILQRYSFESNSQQSTTTFDLSLSCFLSYKDTHLKAIHNFSIPLQEQGRLFSILQRYSFESNSQLIGHRSEYHLPLFSILQRYSFESNSQRPCAAVAARTGCFLSYKDTHLKAIHNRLNILSTHIAVVFYLTKILI